MDQSILQPASPKGTGWVREGPSRSASTHGYPNMGWFHAEHRLFAISALEVAKDDDGIDRGPEYHVSVSVQTPLGPTRASTAQCAWVLDQFGIDGAEEDNHVPHGIVRNFWRPVAETMVGLDCACKEAEPAIVEDKGEYVWRYAPPTPERA